VSFEDIDLPAPAARDGSGESPLVLAVSRHDPRKGLDVLLHALARVAATGIAFRAVLLGSGRLLDADRRLAGTLGLCDRVAIPGRVADVTPYLQRADIFVLPSRAEASGSVSVLEALRWRVAVVASACDGIPEDLTDSRDALLVPPGDVDALQGALAGLLLDPVRRAELAEAGHALHERRFSAARLTGALAGVYAELAAASAGSRLARIASAT
jgi:glycosyltransferase involved in cell wall biosynthesis